MKCVEFIIRHDFDGASDRRVIISPQQVRAVYEVVGSSGPYIGIDVGAPHDYFVQATYEDVIRILGWERAPFPD